MAFGFAGAASGASDALQALLARAFAQKQAEQEMALRQQAADRQAAAQGLQERQFTADEAYRTGQVERQGRLDRQGENQRGVSRMMGDFLMQRGSTPLDTGARNQLMGMGISEGIDVPRAITDAPEAPQGFTLSPGSKRFDASGNVVASVAPTPPQREQRQQPFQWVLRGGEEVYTDNVQPGDKQLSGRQTRPVTGSERKVLGFFQRMLEAERNARAVEGDVGNRDFAAEWLPGAMLENFAKSESGQKYTQAQRTFTEGRLRKESGAAIPQGEYDTDRDTNFRRPGDTKETVAQKRAARLKLLRGAANESGRAFQEFFGEDSTIDALLSEFAEQGQAGGATTPRRVYYDSNGNPVQR